MEMTWCKGTQLLFLSFQNKKWWWRLKRWVLLSCSNKKIRLWNVLFQIIMWGISLDENRAWPSYGGTGVLTRTVQTVLQILWPHHQDVFGPGCLPWWCCPWCGAWPAWRGCPGCSPECYPAFVTADKNIAAKRRKFKNDHLYQLVQHRRNLGKYRFSVLSPENCNQNVLFFRSLNANNPSAFIISLLTQTMQCRSSEIFHWKKFRMWSTDCRFVKFWKYPDGNPLLLPLMSFLWNRDIYQTGTFNAIISYSSRSLSNNGIHLQSCREDRRGAGSKLK